MKKLFVLILVSSFLNTFACVCASISLVERASNSDFIATAKILKVYPDRNNQNFHEIEIEIINLYKGEHINKLKIYSILDSSCSFYTPENTTWLIYAEKNNEGILNFGRCSGARQLERYLASEKYPNAQKNYNESIELELQTLDFIKNNNIYSENQSKLYYTFSKDCFREFKGFEEKSKFSFFELKINSDLTVANVKVLKEFENKNLQQKLFECVKNAILFYKRNKLVIIKQNSKYILCFYYYKAEDGNGNESFISEFIL